VERSNAADGGRLQVLIVQNHPLLASAIEKILEAQSDLDVCGIARSGEDAAALASRDEPTVVLMDFHLPDMTGPAAAAGIRTIRPGVAIVFHSAEDSEVALLDAIDAGATAYLTKSATADQIVEAVKRASKGEVLIPVSLFVKAIARQRTMTMKEHERVRLAGEFTGREREVLELMAQGLETTAMSHRLGIATNTVDWHVRHIIEKLQVHSKLQAVIAAARLGLITVVES
jgi:DNA-binding NarL/FixJ family response regulator